MGQSSVSIGQKNSADILSAIREYLATAARVRRYNPDFYIFETYNRTSIEKILTHCSRYPLLGEKAAQLQRFLNELNVK
jgi:hypothetical protein